MCIETNQQRARATAKKRRWRRRQQRGEIVVPVVIAPEVIESLLNSGRLTDEQSFDREQLGREFAVILGIWAARWKDGVHQ